MLIEEFRQMAEQDNEVMSGSKSLYGTVNFSIGRVFVPDEGGDRKMYYLACPTTKKKVIDNGDGYRCEACNMTHQEATPTYAFSMVV